MPYTDDILNYNSNFVRKRKKETKIFSLNQALEQCQISSVVEQSVYTSACLITTNETKMHSNAKRRIIVKYITNEDVKLS